MRWLRALAILAIPAAAIAIGCEGIIGANFTVTEVDCKHVQPPLMNDKQGGDGPPFSFVAAKINIGEALDGGFLSDLGYDLDGLCTGLGQGPPCRTPPWTDAGAVYDGIDGRDNAIGGLIASQLVQTGFRSFESATLNAGIEMGTIAPPLALRITGYNGFSDDTQVTAEWYMPALPILDGGVVDAGGVVTLAGTGTPLVWRDDKAYVAASNLVAHFDGAMMRIANVPIKMVKAMVVINIGVQPKPGTLYKAVTVGWTTVQTMLEATPFFTLYVNGIPACKGNPGYESTKSYFCSFADMLADNVVDLSRNCNAMSFATLLDFKLATFDPTPRPDDAVDLCPTASPAGDTCDDFDASVKIPRDGGANNCVKAGTPNNDKGIGGYCENAEDCPQGLCTGLFGAPDDAWFCSRLCSHQPGECGAGMECITDTKGTACVPLICIKDAGDDAGLDGGDDAPSDSATE